jgi:hypothetical protein
MERVAGGTELRDHNSSQSPWIRKVEGTECRIIQLVITLCLEEAEGRGD